MSALATRRSAVPGVLPGVVADCAGRVGKSRGRGRGQAGAAMVRRGRGVAAGSRSRGRSKFFARGARAARGRHDAGRARRGAEGRKGFARRGARTARGVFLSLALPAVISWSDGMARAPEVESSFPSPRRSTPEAEAGTVVYALAARRPRESSRGVALTHPEASLSATRPRRARARLRCDGAGRADTESASSLSHPEGLACR